MAPVIQRLNIESTCACGQMVRLLNLLSVAFIDNIRLLSLNPKKQLRIIIYYCKELSIDWINKTMLFSRLIDIYVIADRAALQRYSISFALTINVIVCIVLIPA